MPAILRFLLRLGPTNPIAVRLVQNGGRRVKHMYIRAAYLAVLIVVLLWSLLLYTSAGALSYQQLAAAGAQSFISIAYLQIGLICILAPVFMGSAIAQESGPKVWEVLLTTPLTAGQIVLGNLLGRLFFVIALLACSLPLFALTRYFGGVPGPAIFGSYAVAACAALLVGAIAIALAVSRSAGKRAFFVFYVSVVSYLVVTIAVDGALRRGGQGMGPDGTGVTIMTALNPFLSLRALLNPSTYPSAIPGTQTGVLRWLLETPVLAWCVGSTLVSLLFLTASVITVRAGGLQALGSGSDGVPLTQKLLGRSGTGEEHRAPRSVWHNPIAWREAASRNATPSKLALRVAFLLLGVLFGMLLIYLHRTGELSTSTFRFAMAATVGGELLVIALVAVNTAATAISKEREDGHLDLLLTTPITASAYLWGKLRGLVAYLVPLIIVPLITLLLAGAYVVSGGLGRPAGVEVSVTTAGAAGPATVSAPAILPEAGLLAPLVVVPFMAFCVMVGLHWSLKSKGTLASTTATVGVVGITAGLIGVCTWNASGSIPILGPLMAGLSPASFIQAMTTPEDVAHAGDGGITTTRALLGVGAVIGGLLNAALCYGIHSNMVRTFDQTVRKLAGTG